VQQLMLESHLASREKNLHPDAGTGCQFVARGLAGVGKARPTPLQQPDPLAHTAAIC